MVPQDDCRAVSEVTPGDRVVYRGHPAKVLEIEEAGLGGIQPRLRLEFYNRDIRSRFWVFANELDAPEPALESDEIPF